MLIFNLTIHHLWVRVLAKFQEARAIAYADDGYIKVKLSISLQVLVELKAVFKEDAGLELNVSKTSILPSKGVIIGIGVPIDTDAFVRSFVDKTCRDIIDDVEELDDIQDGFIHYQLLRFCHVTPLQYINSHIILNNRCVLQQQHVDCKIADTLLKKDTKQHTDGWDVSTKDWTHMVLHLPHVEGGFGVSFNCVTKDVVFYTTTSRFVV